MPAPKKPRNPKEEDHADVSARLPLELVTKLDTVCDNWAPPISRSAGIKLAVELFVKRYLKDKAAD